MARVSRQLLSFDGAGYLVAPRGQTQIAILRACLARWRFEVGMFFQGVGADSPESEVRRIAPDHPVFKVEPG